METQRTEQQADGGPVAFVVWWDVSTFAVICPYCGQIEAHTPSRSPNSTRKLCQGHKTYYMVAFHGKTPRQGSVHYEINREKKRLEIAGIKILESKDPMLASGDEHDSRSGGGKFDQDFVRANVIQKQIPAAQIRAMHPFLKLQGSQDDESAKEEWIAREAVCKSHVRERQLQCRTITLETRLRGPYFSSVIELGDLTFLQSRRPTESSIEINAPLGTIDGSPFSNSFVTIKGHQTVRRTVGILVREGSYPPVTAVSGSSNWMTGSEYILDNVKWTLEVQRLACYIIHVFQRNALERDRPDGDTDACHVEKKLIAFFVQKHCFYEEGYEEDVEVLKLKNILPGQGPREAWIAVDNIPCSKCITFKKKVEACFGVKIHFVEMSYDFRRLTPTKMASNLILTPLASGRQQISVQIPALRLEEEGEIAEFEDPGSPSYRRSRRPAGNTLDSPSNESPNTSTKTTLMQRRKRALTHSVDLLEQDLSNITKNAKLLNISKRPKITRFRRQIIFDSDDETGDSFRIESSRDNGVRNAIEGNGRPPSNITAAHEIIEISSDDDEPNDEPSLGNDDRSKILCQIQSRGSTATEASPELATDMSMIEKRLQVVLRESRIEDAVQAQNVELETRDPVIDLTSEEEGEQGSRNAKAHLQRRTHPSSSFFGSADPFDNDDAFDEDYIDGDESSVGSSSSDDENGDGNGDEKSWSGSGSSCDGDSSSDSSSSSHSEEMGEFQDESEGEYEEEI